MKIGVFDSGLGGLSILKSIIKILPQYDYLYLGDNARVPYGGRSTETIYEFTRQAMEFMLGQDCQLIILGCNSATANALRKLQQQYLPKYYPNRRILGIIKPTVEYLAESELEKIGIIGTYATINSNAYVREIGKVLNNAQVFGRTCPLLVPIVEENETGWQGTKMILNKYLRFVKKEKITTLVLACTHYSLLKKQIKEIVGNKVKVIDQGVLVADKLKKYLANHPEIEQKLTKNRQRIYYVTDLNERFEKMSQIFINKPIKIQKVNL